MSTLAMMVGIGIWEMLVIAAIGLFMLGVIGLVVFVAVKAALRTK